MEVENTDKTILRRLENLERNRGADGAAILAQTEDGHWALSGAMSGVFSSMADGIAAHEKRKRNSPLIVIDI